MSPKAGVYVKVSKRYPLCRRGGFGETMVALMECGHATVSAKQYPKKGAPPQHSERMACAICTRLREEKVKEAAAKEASSNKRRGNPRWFKGMPSPNPAIAARSAARREAEIQALVDKRVEAAIAKVLEKYTSPAAPEPAPVLNAMPASDTAA